VQIDPFIELGIVIGISQLQLSRLLAGFLPSVLIRTVMAVRRLSVAEPVVRVERVTSATFQQAIERPQAKRIARGGVHFCRYNYPEGISLHRRKPLAQTTRAGEEIDNWDVP
jgi:hypothetical protein